MLSDFCQLSTTNHRQHKHQHHLDILKDSALDAPDTNKQYKFYFVPCLFTIFRHLFSLAPDLETKGDVFTKLKLAVDLKFNNGEKLDSGNVYRQSLLQLLMLHRHNFNPKQRIQKSNEGNHQRHRSHCKI